MQPKKKSSQKKKYNIPSSFQNILTEEELALFEGYFNCEATKKLREKLVELFEKKVEGSYLTTDKVSKYGSPSWSEYQADAIGYRRSLRELINFLK